MKPVELIIWIVIDSALIFSFAIGIINAIKYSKRIKRQQRLLAEIKVQPFSIDSYFERIDKVICDILQERERQKPPEIVLWWGLDGLRMNCDGSTEWISKRQPQPQTQEYTYNPLANAAQTALLDTRFLSSAQNASPDEIGNMQIDYLRGQIQSLNLQLIQNNMNQNILKMLQSMTTGWR